MAQAAKKASGFFPLGNSKYEDAEEIYEKAANMFKMAKKWQLAGDAFIKASEMHLKLGNKHDIAQCYNSAATCYKKVNPQEAINCLRMAVEIFCELGRFSVAAKQQKEIAELYEEEKEYDECIVNYEKAAEYFSTEDASSSANACLLKVALYSAQLEKYDKAIEIFERVAAGSIDNTLLKYSVKDHFMHAALCHMCTGEIHTAKRALERYQEMDVTFSSTRECEFLKNIMLAFEEGDVDAFTGHVIDFDSISKLNNWKTTMLLRIKKLIKDESGGGEGGGGIL
jgi:alpha-soluble NSF attachment protein